MIVKNNSGKDIENIDILSEELPEGVTVYGKAGFLQRLPRHNSIVTHTDDEQQQLELIAYGEKGEDLVTMIPIIDPFETNSGRMTFTSGASEKMSFKSAERLVLSKLNAGTFMVIDSENGIDFGFD